ncbi:hypothetical protein ABLE93_02700 [Xanthobacter sp. KR7-65]|uniref:hypothetical protein n=1 Tax=Xanthobacter sp. KR7-65 TaxID=3156612 RepID=UPI0032B52BC2
MDAQALAAGFDRIADAEARLAGARERLSRADAAIVTRFLMDLSAALLLLADRREGGIGRAKFREVAAALDLTPPAGLLAALPAAARLAVLDLSALAATLSQQLTENSAAGTVPGPDNEKPRRRHVPRRGRPRLSLVPPSL